MPIIAKKPTYECPPPGKHRGTITGVEDVTDTIGGKFEKKDRTVIKLSFQLDELNSQGDPFEFGELCSLSLHKDSKLTGFLTGLFGKAPEDGFDVETLIGASCVVELGIRESGNGATFPKVLSLEPAGEDPCPF